MAWHKRLLDYDPGVSREWYWSNPDTGEVALETEWNVTSVVEDAKAGYNATDERARWRGDMNHVAYLPNYVVEHYRTRYGINLHTDKEALKWWLNNSDNRCFRTRPGRV